MKADERKTEQVSSSPPASTLGEAAGTHEPGLAGGGARPLPAQFGRYRILQRLGEGGMGAVYLAHDTQLDRRVALKVPHFRPDDGPRVLDRFLREAQAAATLHHPNLCPVHDVGQLDGIHFLTMAYLEGQPLSQLIGNGPPLPQAKVAAVIRKLAQALAHAHAHGVCHRDLKPANVIITREHQPVIMDFGLARRTDKEDVRLTQNGAIMGTPAYMAPEQVMGQVDALGPSCDIYSLGVMLYELLTGRLPFEGSTMMVLSQILQAQPPAPSTLRPDLDPALEAICCRALAKKPAERFASMKQFAEALAVYLRGQGSVTATRALSSAQRAGPSLDNIITEALPEDDTISSPSAPTRVISAPRSRRPLRTVLLCGAVLLVAGGALLVAFGRDRVWTPLAKALHLGKDEPAAAGAVETGQQSSGKTTPASGRKPPPPATGRKPPVLTPFQQAQEALKLKQYDQAIALVGELLRAPTKPGPAFKLRGDAYFGKREYDRAVTDYTEALARGPKTADVYLAHGRAHYRKRRNSQAITDFAEALKIHPNLPLAHAALAAAYHARDDNQLALKECQQGLASSPTAFDHAVHAELLNSQRDYDKALTSSNEAVKLDRQLAYAFACRGDAYAGKHDYTHALGDYTTATRLEPNDPWLYLGRAAILETQAKWEAALLNLDEAIKRDPLDAAAHARKARVLLKMNNQPQALASLEEAFRLNSDSSLAHRVRGEIHSANRQYDPAIQEFTEALKQRPRDTTSLRERALAHQLKNDLENALKDFSAAIAADPTLAPAYAQRAALYSRKREFPKAIGDYKLAIQYDPRNASYHHSLGLVYFQEQDIDKAIEEYTAAIAIDANRAPYWDNRAKAYEKRGKADDLVKAEMDRKQAQSLRKK